MKPWFAHIQRWLKHLRYHPLIMALLRWSKQHSLPGFFRVPIFNVFQLIFKELREQDLFVRANSVAFSFFLSLFPSLMALFTLIPLIKNYLLIYLPEGENFEVFLYSDIQRVMPGVAGDRLFSFIEDITSNPRIGLLSFGFLLAIYFSSNGMIMLMRGFEKSYSTTFHKRKWLRKRWIAILLTFQLGLSVIASVVLIILGKFLMLKIDQLFNLNVFSESLLNILRWLIIILLFYTNIAIIYRFGASTKKKFRFSTPGAALATILCILASVVFSYYVNNFNTYNELYGSIGTIIVLMLWIQMNSLALLIGFELNASIAVNRDLREQIIEEE